ncbi:hypothetical protein B9Z55_024823 [Caenorhabditis nigoni]|uniref:C2H2-type domain-containing protein n=1 Tax=Caenorhabditis nigoni TaxID=1611254 RepID=A0A2G5SW74_9PELO|nr:hypothetical protein B9Z55_024823 [Caenorhabditis nigoni]
MLVIIDIEPSSKFDELVKFMIQNSVDFHVTHRSVGMQKESQIKKTETDEEQYPSPDSIESTQMENVIREEQPLEENQLEPITTPNRFEPPSYPSHLFTFPKTEAVEVPSSPGTSAMDQSTSEELGNIPNPFLTQTANMTSRNITPRTKRGTCGLCKKEMSLKNRHMHIFNHLSFKLYECQECKLHFPQPSHSLKHYQQEHPTIEAKSFVRATLSTEEEFEYDSMKQQCFPGRRRFNQAGKYVI